MAFRGCAPFSSSNIKFESGISGLCYLENQTLDDENAPFWACSRGHNTITGLPRDDKISALKTGACSLRVHEGWRQHGSGCGLEEPGASSWHRTNEPARVTRSATFLTLEQKPRRDTSQGLVSGSPASYSNPFAVVLLRGPLHPQGPPASARQVFVQAGGPLGPAAAVVSRVKTERKTQRKKKKEGGDEEIISSASHCR